MTGMSSAPAGTATDFYARFREQLAKAVVGQEDAIRLCAVALVAQGHVLLEGVPGTGKTLLPKAQQDRFLFKVRLDYPSPSDEMEVLRRWESGIELKDPVKAGVEPVLGAADVERCREHVAGVVLDEKIRKYVVDLAIATRNAPEVALGASTRAEVLLMLAARVQAAFDGSEFVTPDHVKGLLAPAFRHRLLLRPEAEVAGQTPDSVLEAVASRVVPPR